MHELMVNGAELLAQVRATYSEVATNPGNTFHFETGRNLARRLGYSESWHEHLSDEAAAPFAGVANPFSLSPLQPGERVVDMGSGGGFDCMVAAAQVGASGHVYGVDMTPEMVQRARQQADQHDIDHITYIESELEVLPLESETADAVISNGVFNLCMDKSRVFAEAYRVLKAGGRLQFADIANTEPVPDAAVNNIDLWTA